MISYKGSNDIAFILIKRNQPSGWFFILSEKYKFLSEDSMSATKAFAAAKRFGVSQVFFMF